jgi:catechol 2,3-dioxygenase-like lactoylglutathione lyase family enzyme
MYAIDEDTLRENSVTLHVTDPARSQEFYQDLFGLILREDPAPGAARTLTLAGEPGAATITLARRTDDSLGPIWLSIEVATVSEVLDLYLLGIIMGARAMLPRKRGSRWSTVVLDPDGNRISIWTRVPEEVPEALHARTTRPERWEWRLTPPDEQADNDNPRSSMRQDAALNTDAATWPGRRASAADPVDRRAAMPASPRGAARRGSDTQLERKE